MSRTAYTDSDDYGLICNNILIFNNISYHIIEGAKLRNEYISQKCPEFFLIEGGFHGTITPKPCTSRRLLLHDAAAVGCGKSSDASDDAPSRSEWISRALQRRRSDSKGPAAIFDVNATFLRRISITVLTMDG